MVTRLAAGNISPEATAPAGNILREATRQSTNPPTPHRTSEPAYRRRLRSAAVYSFSRRCRTFHLLSSDWA